MGRVFSLISKLFRGLWKVAFAIYALFIIASLGVVGVLAYGLLSGSEAPTVEPHSVLVWAPEGEWVSQPAADERLLQELVSPSKPVAVVRDYVDMLARAAQDDRVEAVVLRLDKMGGAQPGQLEELAGAISLFKASGKPLVAWSDHYDQGQYFLASRASQIAVDPLGEVFLRGFGVFNHYYADALERLDIEVNVFRVGTYKSFVEPYIRNNMSEAAKENTRYWLQELWANYLLQTQQARGVSSDELTAYTQHFADWLAQAHGDGAKLALDKNLVDKVATRSQTQKALRSSLEQDDLATISGQAYLQATTPKAPAKQPIVALVAIDGALVDGDSVAGAAGGDTVAELIKQARDNNQVKALVLRVNSPGGSVTASEKIRREVAKTQQAGKPVVVSMSGMAASGGYWVSMDADEIWAMPMTITGSIGVFGMIPTFGKTLENWGIYNDGIGTTPMADAMRLDRPMSPAAKTMVQANIDHIYQVFIGQVAQARGLSKQAVDKAAQGQVWTGLQAKQRGLIDQLGGLYAAANAAAEKAGLAADEFELVLQQSQPSWRQALKSLLSARAVQSLLPEPLLKAQTEYIEPAVQALLSDPKGQYARCFCELD